MRIKIICNCFRFLLIFLLAITPAHSEESQTSNAITSFLQGQETETESAELQYSEIANLDDDDNPEVIIVWSRLGATWWSNHLTVLKRTGKEFITLDTRDISGMPDALAVSEGLIRIARRVHGPGDARCCPKKRETVTYTLSDGSLTETKE